MLSFRLFPALALAGYVPLVAQVTQEPPVEGAGRGTSGAIQRRMHPPARIISFTAEPATVKAGESTVLSWATENPNAVSIDQAVGRVPARGTMEVSPGATTTYTLTVDGPEGTLARSVTVTVSGAPAGAATASTAKKEAPRLPDGKPDLSGVYNFGGGGRGGAGQAGPTAGLPPGVSATPALKAGSEKFRVNRGPNDAGRTSDCMPLAGPDAFSVPYQFQLVHSTTSLAILHEYPGTFRIIPTTGGLHPPDPDPTWMGDSIAHWEGDTLVVDTVGFNDKTEIGGYKHTEALHLVERFARTNFDTLQYQAIIEDPNVFEGPFAVNRTFALRPDLAKVDEFVCENNRDYTVFFKQ
jgi:hypothetical protein